MTGLRMQGYKCHHSCSCLVALLLALLVLETHA
jgi:hypothetical protein